MSMVGKAGYKETAIGWIPEVWGELPLGDIASTRKSKAVAAVGLKCIEMEHIEQETGRILGWDATGAQASVKTAFLEGDVLFGKLRPYLRKFAIAPFAGICTTEILAIYPESAKAHSSFLFYLMQGDGVFNTVNTLSYGTKMPRVSWTDLSAIPLPIPPLPEQEKIAAILTAVDDKLDVIARQIDATNTLKRGLMQTLFSQGVGTQDANGQWHAHTDFQQTELGEIPAGWGAEKLGSLANKVGSGVTPKGGSDAYLDEGIPLIRSQNVLVGALYLDDVVFISQAQHEKMSNSALQANDVLLNITGASIGRCAKLPADFVEGNVNQHVCIIRTEPKLDPTYLCHYLNSEAGQNQVNRFQAGGNREGLNYQQIRSFDVPLPVLSEQQKIASILDSVDAKLDVLAQKQTHYQTLKRGLMQKLLTGEWRVQI